MLVENHRAFLRFLERRVGDRTLAEVPLQEAFTRNLDRLSDMPDEGLVPCFYRVPRNLANDSLWRKGRPALGLARRCGGRSWRPVGHAPSTAV